MKKVAFIFLFLFVMFFQSINVKAASNHIYHVNKLNVNTGSQVLEIEGFAYIAHMDNYGDTNLTTFIEVTGGGKSLSFQVDYVDDGKTVFDYYFGRCMDSSHAVNDKCSSLRALQVRDGVGRPQGTCNTSTASDCAYFNVDFKVNIKLSDIFKEFGEGTKLSFNIISIVDGVREESSFGVISNNCYINDQPNSCSTDGGDFDISIGSGKITMSGVANEVKTVVEKGLARSSGLNVLGTGIYYSDEERYTVAGYHSGGQFQKYNSNVYFWSKYYDILGTTSGELVVPGSDSTYAIFAFWVQAAYGLEINFGGPIVEPDPEYECLNGYDETSYGEMNATCGNKNELSACKKEPISGVKVYYKLTDDEWAAANHSEKTCLTSRYVEVPINTTITTPHGTSVLGVLIHQKGVFDFGGATSQVYAGRGFKFPTLTYNNTIFGIFSHNIEEAYSTGFEASWDKVKVETDFHCYRDPVTRECLRNPDGSYQGYNETKYDCEDNGGSHTFYLDTKNVSVGGGVFESPSGGSISVKELLEKTASNIMNNEVINDSNYPNSKPTSYKSNGEFDQNLIVVDGSQIADQEGYKSDTFKVFNITNGGYYPETIKSFTDNVVTTDYKYDSSFSYDINDPYIQVTDKAGNGTFGYIYYGDVPETSEEYKELPDDNYYVSLLFPEDKDFLVKFKNSYLSFINGIDWNLDGNCNIDVINNVYDCVGKKCEPKYMYRPIDVYTPFPNNKIPINWEDWMDNELNRTRLNNSYSSDNLIYYVKLKKGERDGDIISLNEINNIGTNYNIWSTMNESGSNSFLDGRVSSLLGEKKSYCELGKFKGGADGCDD